MLSIYGLPNQAPDEKIVKIVRRDLLILFQKILIFLVLIVIPLVFFAMFISWMPSILTGTITYALAILLVSAYYMFAWLFMMFMFIDYYLDVVIITSERIIDIDQQGFFHRIVSELRLDRIQDVASEVKGVLPTIFKYGDLRVQTAAEKQMFYFEEIPSPESVRDLLIKLAEQSRAKHPPVN